MTILEQLPGRIDELASQILQLRAEMRAEFSALHTEIRTGDEETRRSLRDEMHTEFSALQNEIRAGDERVLNQARGLHEDVMSRLALIQEGGRRRRKRPDTAGDPQ